MTNETLITDEVVDTTTEEAISGVTIEAAGATQTVLTAAEAGVTHHPATRDAADLLIVEMTRTGEQVGAVAAGPAPAALLEAPAAVTVTPPEAPLRPKAMVAVLRQPLQWLHC